VQGNNLISCKPSLL